MPISTVRAVGALLVLSVVAACEDSTGPLTVGPPAALQIVAGDAQSDTVGHELPEALVVRVVDSAGRAIPLQVINFRVTAGGGSVFAGVALTDMAGQARERWTLGTVARDTQRVEARAVDTRTGQPPVFGTFQAVGVPDGAASVVVAPATQADSARFIGGDTLLTGDSVAFVAVARDRYNNLKPSPTVTWASGDTAIASVSASGLVVVKKAGAGSVRATVDTAAASRGFVVIDAPRGWFALTPMLSARRNFGASSVGDRMYVMGGFGAENGVEVYQVSANRWSALAPMLTGRHELAAAAVNGIVYAIGGQAAPGGPSAAILSAVEAFDPATNTWTARASMPTARTGLVVAVVNSLVYAIGGCAANECQSGRLSTMEVYDPVTNSWSTKAPMPTARGYAAAAVSNGIIYVTGGRNAAGPNYIATMEAYDPATDTWATKASMPTGRQWHAMATLNGLVYSIAGYAGVQLSSVEVYDPIADRWSTSTPIPTHRLYLSAVTIGGVIYAAGGYNTSLLATLEGFRP